MENVGCVTITEQLLFRSKVTDTMYELRADVILHEMAHMWFGDLVTMKWWDDLWLNESFAEFCAAPGERRGDPVHRRVDHVLRRPQDLGLRAGPAALDASDRRRRADARARRSRNFDGISYAKGASVLKQLVAYVGRDNFFAGIRAYFAEHAWGNATLADLLRALEASSGEDLGDWSKAWLETAGPNTLRSEFTVDDEGRFTAFAVLQEAPAEHPTLRPHHIAIGLYNRA